MTTRLPASVRDYLRRHPELKLTGVRVAHGVYRAGWGLRLPDTLDTPLPPVPVTRTDAPSVSPVFVVSAGWRSGSTAVQRLLCSSGEVFVWGEPFAEARLYSRLSLTLAQAMGGHDAAARTFLPTEDEDVSAKWIANTHPPAEQVLIGIRAMLEATYWPPLAERGFRGWGVKEVNLSPMALRLLLAAFPEARFVFLVREPGDAYASFRRYVVHGINSRSVGRRLRWVYGPFGFAAVWRGLAEEFLAHRGDPRCLLVRYEDIKGRESFVGELAGFTGLELDRAAWRHVVGSVEHTASQLQRLESRVVRAQTREVALRWGYKSDDERQK